MEGFVPNSPTSLRWRVGKMTGVMEAGSGRLGLRVGAQDCTRDSPSHSVLI